MIDATDTTFQTEVLDSDQTVFVDFWAPWCGPCKSFSPVFEAIAQANPHAKFVKVNIDETDIAQKYGVRGIPTVVAFRDGKPLRTKTGAMTTAIFEGFVTSCC